MSQPVRTGGPLRYRNENGSTLTPGTFNNAIVTVNSNGVITTVSDGSSALVTGSQHVRVSNPTATLNVVQYFDTDVNNGFTIALVGVQTRITIPVTGMYFVECNFVATGLEHVYTVTGSTTGTIITMRPGALNGTTGYQQSFMTRMVSLIANEYLSVTAVPGTTLNADSFLQVTRIR